MKIHLSCLVSVVVLLAGCGRGEKPVPAAHAEAPAGAFFKAAKGVVLTEETRKHLGVEVADVEERKLSRELRFSAQVFGEEHHLAPAAVDHGGCDARASALVPQDLAKSLRPGQTVAVRKGPANLGGPEVTGVVLNLQPAAAPGEWEVVLSLPRAASLLLPGEFVTASLSLPGGESVASIPSPALLRTVDGTFVYTVSGDAYFRTPVQVGGESNGWVEVLDGLLTGDQVVTRAVDGLWLVELRATNGGDACTH